MSATNLPPCRCGDPDRFHDGPCCAGHHPEQGATRADEKNPTILESVVRSPRFYALKQDRDGWFIVVRTGAEVAGVAGLELFDGLTIDAAIAAAAMRIVALDEADRKERTPSLEERLRRINELWGKTLKGLDDEERKP